MAQTMTEPRELLLHELGDIHYAENVLVKALPKMAEEAQDEQLRSDFEHHAEETRAQIENLERAFAELGEKPKGERCPGIEGIKAEHYEIAAYSSMITMAQSLGEERVAELLDANLQQERKALEKLETCGRRLAGNGNGASSS